MLDFAAAQRAQPKPMNAPPETRPEDAPPSIAVVIPCHREKAGILDVLAAVGPEVERIFVIDDACPEKTGDHVEAHAADPRITVIRHTANQGVGGATLTGYAAARNVGADVAVKLDGDGQMDPAEIPRIAAPVLEGRADYAKGNRFHSLEDVRQMPKARVFGNLGLSFATKLSSGYWDAFDPTNGFTAIHAKALDGLPFEKIDKGYFFESDILFRLYLARAVVRDVPMRARYGDESSGLKIGRVLWEFPLKHARNAIKRVLYAYFLRDFTMASIELFLALPFMAFGVAYGGYRWLESEATGVPATAGTVVLAALPIILGFQMLLGFLDHDTRNMPKEPLQKRS